VPHNKGMDWIRLHQRMRIYARDHFDCVWCRMIFPTDDLGYGLSLDHFQGRSNAPSNLVTCCIECNSARKGLTTEEWAGVLGYRMFEAPEAILERARAAVVLPLPPRDVGLALARARRPNYRGW
jgi:hypothetical protein